MQDRHHPGRELLVGLVLGLIVIAIAAYWMWAASRNAVPFVLAFGLPNSLLINLLILVVLAAIVGFAFVNLKRPRR
jgi:hypothetical protein